MLCGASHYVLHILGQNAVLHNLHDSPNAESDGVSAEIGSGVVLGGSEVRFRRVLRGFRARVLQGFCEGFARVRRELRDGCGDARGDCEESSVRVSRGFHKVP